MTVEYNEEKTKFRNPLPPHRMIKILGATHKELCRRMRLGKLEEKFRPSIPDCPTVKKVGRPFKKIIDAKKEKKIKIKISSPKPKKEKKKKMIKIKIVKKPDIDLALPAVPQQNNVSLNQFIPKKIKIKIKKTPKEIIEEIRNTPIESIINRDPMRAGRDRALALMRDTSIEDMITSLNRKTTGPTRKAPSRPQRVNREIFNMPQKTETRKITKTGEGPSRPAPTRAKAEYDAAGREVIKRRGARIEQSIAGKKARGPLKKKPSVSFAEATRGTNKVAGLSFAQMVAKGRGARRFT